LLNMVLGAFLGGLLSVTWTMWREMSSNHIRSDAELERILDAPVLARLPRINKRQLQAVGK